MKHILLYVLVLIIITFSCTNKESETHDHEHETIRLNFTEYNDQFELFAETDPFIVGETTNILAHFTNLSDFKPLFEGSVRIELHVGTKGIGQTIEKPIRPGIYQFALQPIVKGKGKLIFNIKNEKGNHKIIVKNIVVYDNEHDASHVAEELANVNAINFTKEQSWKIDFATTQPKMQQFGKIIKTTAQILSDNTDEMEIISKTNGIVFFQDNITEGKNVKAGEALLNVSGSGLANENTNVRFQEVQNNYELSKSNYERTKALYQNKIVSEKELENAKRDFENAKAIYDNLKKNFNENGQVVISPKNGIVKHIHVKNGQYVEAGEKLFVVAGNKNLLIKAELQQKHYAVLNAISSVNIKSIIDNKIYSLTDLNGKLISYGKSIDEEEGYLIPVNFQIENNNKFLSGSFVEVFIRTKSNEKALIVPNSALVEEQGNFYVFVQLTPELFEKREVKIGDSDGTDTEILSGLSSAERIVSKGAIIVKLAAVSNSLDPHAGHVH